MSGPFHAFAQSIQPQTPLRAAITAAWRRPEPECLPPLIEQAKLTPARTARARALATRLVEALREKTPSGGVEGLIHEYALSSQEGVALMCLAEALLRIPDDDTRDALIRDKIGGGDWRAHLGHSPSLFVNAATWGLMLTGRLTATSSEQGLSAALVRLIGRGGEPLIRTGVNIAMRLMGEQFVAGQTIGEALDNARDREERGFRHSYDMLGEAAVTAEQALNYMEAYEAAIHAIGEAARGRGIYEGPGISIKLSALHPRYSRAQIERVQAELYPRLKDAGRAGAALRHRPQHRCRGGRSAGDLARSSGAALLRARARRLERRRLRRAGLPEARALHDRLADRSGAPLASPADGAAGQGRLLGRRDQARPARRACRTTRCSRGASTPTCPTSPARAGCWPRPMRRFRSSPRTMRSRSPPSMPWPARTFMPASTSSSACTAWASRCTRRSWDRTSSTGRAASTRRSARTRRFWPIWCAACWRTAPTPRSSTRSPIPR